MDQLIEIPGVLKLLYVVALIVVALDLFVWRATA